MTTPNSLLDEVQLLVEELPAAAIAPLVSALSTCQAGQWNAIKSQAQGAIASAHFRGHVTRLVDHWQASAADIAPQSIALAIQTAAYCHESTRRQQSLELVWTGPSSAVPLRRTDQVLLQVIESARYELIIVTFVAFRIPTIQQALIQAADRNVRLHIIIESAKESAGKVTYDNLIAIGPQVAALARVYRWPFEKRPQTTDGKHGSLHVKCAVADADMLLISSANLTEFALTLNMELGVLIQGGPIPRQVMHHLKQLITNGTLVVTSP